jgi:hypothetical protein
VDGPISVVDPLAYIPDQHDCPLPCAFDYANVYIWTPFYSTRRLRRCYLPMLLQIIVLHLIDDPNTNMLIRSYTLEVDVATIKDRTILTVASVPIKNPKKGRNLVEVSLDNAPACAIDGERSDRKLSLASSPGMHKKS